MPKILPSGVLKKKLLNGNFRKGVSKVSLRVTLVVTLHLVCTKTENDLFGSVLQQKAPVH